jgi:glutaredoxin-related protein
MIKIYGMSTCPDCAYLYDQIEGRDYEMIDIGTHVKLLKEFLKIRDNSPIFDECKEKGYAGIPCFVLEDGTVTLEAEAAGLRSRPQEEH